ncbi:MAG: lasso peptide biosynthesis B2 protein [Candidatus Aminicenantes bacterium]|nr:lasso peptide biosynthesis B2 protein [Candidatus Aminicenantes bacterium]MDH5704729.1 lasso peptide biosynthesis B2 protein [Candidatus Aminicenantes bacterium]
MVWTETIRKLGYYRNLSLLSRTFFTSLKISLSSKSQLISLANPRQNGKAEEKEIIVKYAHLCLYLRRCLGFKDSCLTSSLLLCSLLRQYGIDARVNFSAKKDNEKMAGHCWVSVGDEKISSDYELIFRYP